MADDKKLSTIEIGGKEYCLASNPLDESYIEGDSPFDNYLLIIRTMGKEVLLSRASIWELWRLAKPFQEVIEYHLEEECELLLVYRFIDHAPVSLDFDLLRLLANRVKGMRFDSVDDKVSWTTRMFKEINENN